jgi:hypothetical protein
MGQLNIAMVPTGLKKNKTITSTSNQGILLNANSDSVGLGQVHIFTDNADVLV